MRADQLGRRAGPAAQVGAAGQAADVAERGRDGAVHHDQPRAGGLQRMLPRRRLGRRRRALCDLAHARDALAGACADTIAWAALQAAARRARSEQTAGLPGAALR